MAVLSMPRLYNYPKVFFYVAAIVVAWRYASRPDRGRLIALAVVTVVAFLFRHDHGVYIGLATLALLAILHWPHPRRVVMAVAEYSSVTLLLMLPFLIFVQSTVGLLRYAGNAAALPLQIRMDAREHRPHGPIRRTVAAVRPAGEREVGR